MQTSIHVNNINGTSILVPNKVFNLEDTGYVSYNSYDLDLYGTDTTALVNSEMTKFLILNGDHRNAYFKLKTYDKCLEYFKNYSSQKNKFSDNI